MEDYMRSATWRMGSSISEAQRNVREIVPGPANKA